MIVLYDAAQFVSRKTDAFKTLLLTTTKNCLGFLFQKSIIDDTRWSIAYGPFTNIELSYSGDVGGRILVKKYVGKNCSPNMYVDENNFWEVHTKILH